MASTKHKRLPFLEWIHLGSLHLFLVWMKTKKPSQKSTRGVGFDADHEKATKPYSIIYGSAATFPIAHTQNLRRELGHFPKRLDKVV